MSTNENGEQPARAGAGVVGLGVIGAGLATSLMERGVALTVCDVRRGSDRALPGGGARGGHAGRPGPPQ